MWGHWSVDPDLVGRPFYQLRNTQIRDQTDDRSKFDQQVQLPEPLPIWKFNRMWLAEK